MGQRPRARGTLRRIRPVHLGDAGDNVSILHAGLGFIIRNQPGITDNDRIAFQAGIAAEVNARTFGNATARVVGIWQNHLKQRRHEMPRELGDRMFNLPILANGEGNGDVDDLTADALNFLLGKLGAFR